MNFQEFLTTHGLSPSDISWIADKTAEQAWQQCQRTDWMLWLVSRIAREQELKHEIVRVAADIARAALAHTTDQPVHACVSAVDRWLTGERVDLQGIQTAAVEPRPICDASDAGAYAITCAARAASETATWTVWAALDGSAAAAAACTQMAMEWAVAADAMSRAEKWDVTRTTVQAQQADIVRKHIPWATIQPLLERALQEVS